jgi:UDP-N-acetylmuramyl pentapeptide synthase
VERAARARRSTLHVRSFTDAAALVDAVASDAKDGDVILVKGSRAMKLDEFVAGLVEKLMRRE